MYKRNINLLKYDDKLWNYYTNIDSSCYRIEILDFIIVYLNFIIYTTSTITAYLYINKYLRYKWEWAL